MALLRFFIVVFLAGQPVFCRCQTTDFSLQVEILGDSFVQPGTARPIRLTMSNKGPDPLPGIRFFVTTFYVAVPSRRTVAIFPIAQTAPCRINYTDLGGDEFLDILGPPGNLAAGESFSCVVGLTTFDEAPDRIVQRFIATRFGDVNQSNNFVDIEIRTRNVIATPVPSMGMTMTLALASMCLLLGALSMRRRA
jgi:hypothetical protein